MIYEFTIICLNHYPLFKLSSIKEELHLNERGFKCCGRLHNWIPFIVCGRGSFTGPLRDKRNLRSFLPPLVSGNPIVGSPVKLSVCSHEIINQLLLDDKKVRRAG